jgi:peroxiredoxin/predicted 2-oxoglutarate/Fe(II)-dependent dioxygenase YbiX
MSSLFEIGDPVPWFTLPSSSNPNYHFDTVGGYRVVLFFFGSTKVAAAAQAVRDFCNLQRAFAAIEVPFFGVSVDPDDQFLIDTIESPSFCKFLWDYDHSVSRQFGVLAETGLDQVEYLPTAFVLDENLRILQIFPFQQAENYASQILAYVSSLPRAEPPVLASHQAPVLFIPRVLSPELCQELIQLYEADGGRDSGFMRDVKGKTMEILDPAFKKRRDLNLSNTPLLETFNQIVLRRIKPEIEKVFHFSITRFERHLIACYESANQGFFNRHRDNTTKGTMHRRFAMSLNLNTGKYEGGCLRFPEYGTQLYRPETGEAVIFSCSLLHEATPVTAGRRFALLSFFYNDADVIVRENNRQFLDLKPPAATPQPTAAARSITTKGFQAKTVDKKRR